MDGNTWRRYRLLTERGTEPPFFLEPDNPDDMARPLHGRRVPPLADYFSSLNVDLTGARHKRPRGGAAPSPKSGIRVRSLDPTRFVGELRRVHALSLTAFRRTSCTRRSARRSSSPSTRRLEPHLRPELVLLAEAKDRVVGFIFAIPDLRRPPRGQPIDTMIAKTMAVHPEHGGVGLGGAAHGPLPRRPAGLGLSPRHPRPDARGQPLAADQRPTPPRHSPLHALRAARWRHDA